MLGLGMRRHPWRWCRRFSVLLGGRWCVVGMHVVPENVLECVNSQDLRSGRARGGASKCGPDGMQRVEKFVFKCGIG